MGSKKEIIGSIYSSKLLELEERPSDVICKANGILSPTIDVQNICKRHYDGVSEGVASFVSEPAEILGQAARQRKWRIALKLVALSIDIQFENYF